MKLTFRSVLERAVDSVPLSLYCWLVNLRCALRGKQHRVAPFEGAGALYTVSDKSGSIVLCRRGRHNMHKNGTVRRTDSLAMSYLLPLIDGVKGGTLIDCGANIGELGRWAQSREMFYIPFEPETLEADCCDLNNFSGQRKTQRLPLWHSDEILKFYRRPREADGSVLPSGNDGDFVEIQARRLDAVIDAGHLTSPAVLKVEAEGAEPEVLEGSRRLFPNIDFITVDCGYERGARDNPKHTFIECNKILTEAGYEVVAADLRRCSFLFRRRNSRFQLV